MIVDPQNPDQALCIGGSPMATMSRPIRWTAAILAAIFHVLAPRATPAGGLVTVSSGFLPDREFSRLLPYILDGWDLKHGMGEEKPYESIVPIGAYALLTIRNTTEEPATVDSLHLNGIDLTRQIAPVGRESQGILAANYLLNDAETTPPDLRQRLDALGQPIWYQVRPNPIPPNGFAEVMIRFRRIPSPRELDVVVRAGDEREAATGRLSTARPARLAIASVDFTDSIDRAFIYLRSRTGDDFEVHALELDGHPIPLGTAAPRNSDHGFLPIEVPLDPSWDCGSFHHIAVSTVAGESVASVVRARDAFFALGMWGYRNNGNSDMERARDTLITLHDHLFNTHMGMGHAGEFNSEQGHAMFESMGMRLMTRDPSRKDTRWPGLYARFLMDEPDAHEDAVRDLPPDRRLGAYAQGLVERQRRWTENDTRTLCLLNVDLTYKPQNWITYGRLPDILACDPYYQMRLKDTYWRHPGWLARNCTPYYVFAIGEVARWASEPRPLHLILNSVSVHDEDRVFRYGTPEEKRVEFYYALAAGAKGISYWWFTPYGTYRGCGADEPGAIAMMDEMKRLNAEARSLEPLLARAHPAAEAGTAIDPFVSARPPWLMTRTLVAGTQTLLIVCVNRDHASDRVGTLFEPIPKAPMNITPPAWMRVADSFILTRDGVAPISFTSTDGKLSADLKDIQLTAVVVLTSDPDLQQSVTRKWTELSTHVPSGKKE